MKTVRAVALCFITTLGLAQSATTAKVTIDASRVENHISPRMYAAFVEMMDEDVKWGLTAEMLHDRSFEEPADYLGLPADWRLEPDTRNDNGGAIQFAPTTEQAYPATNQATGKPEHALRLTLAQGDIQDTRTGFSQGRLSISQGVAYNGYLWAKLPAANPFTGAVSIALEEDNTDGETYAYTTLAPIASGDWQQIRFTLTPSKTDRFAKLSVLFNGKGVLYLDQLSLEPALAIDQVRPDSETMIAGLHPSFLRWPGGNVAQDYHWQWGIGPRDLRPVWNNTAWSNAPEPGDLGTDEYLAVCARLHIEPSITINLNGAGATPEEAAAWVEYVNGPATSKYGAMRAANGHPAPYAVHQWELGNEIFGNWVRGHVPAEQYAQAALVYAHAMRAVDPSIRLIAVGEGIYPASDTWNSTVLKIAGPSIDFLAVHDYNSTTQNASSPNPRASMFARAGEFEANYRHMGDLIHQLSPAHPIKLIVNEWNLFYNVDVIQSMQGAVYAARLMNGFERDGDIVEANCISDLLNGWAGGVIQASRDRIYGTAQYYALKLYSDHLGTDRLHTEVTSPELAPNIPALDAVATRSADGRTVFLKLSNAAPDHPLPITISLHHLPHTSEATLDLLASDFPASRNTFEQPTRILPTSRIIHCTDTQTDTHADMYTDTCSLELPPTAVAVLTLHLTR